MTAELGKLGIDVKDGKVRRADVKAVIDNVVGSLVNVTIITSWLIIIPSSPSFLFTAASESDSDQSPSAAIRTRFLSMA